MDTPPASELNTTGTTVGADLHKILLCKDIEPGASPSYQMCKVLYTAHPLGKKMVDSPILMAQSQERKVTVQEAPKEVIKAFEREWKKLEATKHIRNARRLARIYGISTLAVGIKNDDPSQPLDMKDLWKKDIWFNEWDPLNTAGSLVLSQIPTAPDFNKPRHVQVNGSNYHLSRAKVVMNEEPIYLDYTVSAFGFVGRSVYQRALYPMKSYIRTMIANDMVQTKLGLIVAQMESPGSIVTEQMGLMQRLKMALLKQAKTGEVISVGKEETVTTLNMQNVDGAGAYSRTNIIKDIATSADMPAKMLDNETLVSGFGEGTEDAKNIARYIESVRTEMEPEYAWFDNIVMHRAWTPTLYETIQRNYPVYANRTFEDAFSEWREAFSAEWPSLLMEPESERVKVQDVQLQAIVAVLQTLLDRLDPPNQVRLIQWARDNIAENTLLFAHEMDLDADSIEAFLDKQQERADQEAQGFGDLGPEAKKFGKFDSSQSGRAVTAAISELRRAMGRLPERHGRSS